MLHLTRRQLLATSAAFLVAPRLGQASDVRVSVEVDPVFEWLFALARAAGFEEYQRGLPEWNDVIDAALSRLKAHRVLEILREARTDRVGYDAVPRLAAWLVGPPEELTARAAWTPWPVGLDERWRKTDLPAFVSAAADAARIVQFSSLLVHHASLGNALVTRLEKGIGGFDLGWFDAFFGRRVTERVRVLASPSTGVNNYGAEADIGGTHVVFAVLGAQIREGVPSYQDSLGVLVHEVGHAFVGPVVRAHGVAFEPAGQRLFATVGKAMTEHAYGDWSTVVEESLLRACVVRYFGNHEGVASADRRVQQEHQNGFPWVATLAARLGEYEADRVRWPTLDDFVPDLATSLDAIAADVEMHASRAPKVLSTIPADGARNVDPDCTTLVVTFDRPMTDQSWAVVGGGPAFPKTSNPSYDTTRTVFTLTIGLEADHDYELWLNSGRYQSFHAENGEPLAPVHLRFHTRSRQ